MKHVLGIGGIVLAAVAAVLFAAPGPIEPACNPQRLFANNSINATQLGGAGKREVAWFAAGMATNAPTTGAYLKFYDTAAAPTVGTTATTAVFGIQASTATNAAGPPTIAPGAAYPMQFISGLWVTLTGNVIDADNTAIGNNAAWVTVCWM
jgi:hypothetical protein